MNESVNLPPHSFSELAFALEQQRSGESTTEELKDEFAQRISAAEKKLTMVLKVHAHTGALGCSRLQLCVLFVSLNNS